MHIRADPVKCRGKCRVLINGEPVDLKKHNVAYIFQEYSTMSWLTVEENVAFGLKMKRCI